MLLYKAHEWKGIRWNCILIYVNTFYNLASALFLASALLIKVCCERNITANIQRCLPD